MLKKERSRQYPTETITDADYTDDIVLLVNTPAQAKSLMHTFEQAAGGIGLHMNANKTECFYWGGAISTLNGGPLKLVDKFMYLSSSVSSTESDVSMPQEKTDCYR